MEKKSRLLRVLVAFLATGLLVTIPAPSIAADIYFVYSGKDRELLKQITRRVPASLSVKSYNIDLLALADYSGKQKVTAKLKRADFVVFVNDRARKPFESSFDEDPNSFIVNEPDNIDELLKRLAKLHSALRVGAEKAVLE
ncbi:MAG: hypothetical protein ACE5FO_12845 [Parvularculaceae bacterium]